MADFRWHRGSLEESTKTSVTVNDFSELHSLIKNELPGIEVKKEDIDIKYYVFDNRLSAKTYIVTLKDYGVLGLMNSDFTP